PPCLPADYYWVNEVGWRPRRLSICSPSGGATFAARGSLPTVKLLSTAQLGTATRSRFLPLVRKAPSRARWDWPALKFWRSPQRGKWLYPWEAVRPGRGRLAALWRWCHSP